MYAKTSGRKLLSPATIVDSIPAFAFRETPKSWASWTNAVEK